MHALFREELQDHDTVSVGIALTKEETLEQADALLQEHEARPVTLIHAGFPHGRELSERLANFDNVSRYMFLYGQCGKLYQRHFREHHRALVRDGFERRRNKDHPPEEFFSDLHAIYQGEGMDGLATS